MRKKVLIIVIVLVSIGLFLYFRYIYGWSEFKFYKETPKNYLNSSVINKENYSLDSANIVFQMKGFIKNHQESYYPIEYNDATQVIIDTILYSPDYKKNAVLVITKNPVKSQSVNNKWYYNATCYLGIKQQDAFVLSWIGPNYNDFSDLKSISQKIREYCFKKKSASSQDNDAQYNLDDIRYWGESKDWQRVKDKQQLQKSFEDEKLKNPENTYEPK
ncbi:MAG TPA: hypothetical protein DIT10_05930 [Chryseobacterium sp.]|nr:hypothetical protein [Chryseobacterium sp.]